MAVPRSNENRVSQPHQTELLPIPVVPNRGASSFDSIRPDFDPVRLRAERLERLRQAMVQHDLDALILFDPNNQRYATGSRNMFQYFLRNSTRYIYVPTAGPVILFEYPGSDHISTWLETIAESRVSRMVFAAVNGRDDKILKPFAREIVSLLSHDAGRSRRVGMDRCFHGPAQALEEEGVEVIDVMQLLHCFCMCAASRPPTRSHAWRSAWRPQRPR